LYGYVQWLVRKNTARRGLDVDDMVALWREQGGRCALTGLRMTHKSGTGQREPANGSVDRIDPGGPYLPGNVRWTRTDANLARQSMTDEGLVELCDAILSEQTTRAHFEARGKI
jgi:hypothetical protein